MTVNQRISKMAAVTVLAAGGLLAVAPQAGAAVNRPAVAVPVSIATDVRSYHADGNDPGLVGGVLGATSGLGGLLGTVDGLLDSVGGLLDGLLGHDGLLGNLGGSLGGSH